MFIEKDRADNNCETEESLGSIFLKENIKQLRAGLGLPENAPFEEVTKQLRTELHLPAYASCQEIVDAINQDLNK